MTRHCFETEEHQKKYQMANIESQEKSEYLQLDEVNNKKTSQICC